MPRPLFPWRQLTSAATFFLVLATTLGGVAADVALELPLYGETKAVFAGVEEGKKILTAKDDFTQSLSKLDLQIRMQRKEETTLDEWKTFVTAEVLPWSDEEIAHVKPAVALLAEKLKKFKLPLPNQVHLVHMSGKDEGDAAYTRANAIFLPSKVLSYPADQLEALLAHELFHVLSRHDAETRQRLYGIIGFRACEEIPLPAVLKDRKLTNPDAPRINCTIDLKIDGKVVTAAPVLFFKGEKYDGTKGGSVVGNMTFGLMVVEKKDDKWQPQLQAGNPLLLNGPQVPSFLEQIGKNTGYIIHPDEILADNFIQVLNENKNVPTPKILEQMQSVLKR